MRRHSVKAADYQQVSNGQGRWLLEALCMLLLVGLVAAVCIRLSEGKILWEDEVLGWTLVRDQSWRHMLHAWNLGADSGGILFYFTARCWFWLFGASVTSFRCYSAACFAAGIAVLWIALRPYYSWQTRLVSIAGSWFIGTGITAHIGEGRFYGLFMLGATLSFCVTLRVAASARGHTRRWFLLSLLANGILVTSHLLGFAYSLALLGGLMVVDYLRKRPRYVLYVPPLLACCFLLPEQRAIRSAIAVSYPHSWIARPNLHSLASAYFAFDARTDQLLLLLMLAVLAFTWRSGQLLANDLLARFRQCPELYLVTSGVAFIPIALYVESHIATPAYLGRYLLPVSIVTVILSAEALRLIGLALSSSSHHRSSTSLLLLQSVSAVAFVIGAGRWTLWNSLEHIPQRGDYTQDLADSFPKGSTVVLPDSLIYTEVIARQYDSPVRFMYLLDWERSIREGAPRADVSAFHLISSWQQAGYYPNSMQESGAFLRDHPLFFVMETRLPFQDFDPGETQTVLASIARTPHEEVYPLSAIKLPGLEDKVWLVCRDTCGSFQTRNP